MNRHQSSNSLHWPSLILGAALVLAGFALGKLGNPENSGASPWISSAHAQEYTSVNTSFFRSGAPGIMTQSADGKTIYLWGLQNRVEQIDERFAPKFAGHVSAPD